VARAAFLTLEDRGSFVVDDSLAVDELARRGWQVDEVPWTRPAAWERYDCVVVRTTWDYQRDVGGFLSALERIAATTALWNPVEVIRWNVEKTYLEELAARGVAVVPTAFGHGSPESALAARRGRHVVKPVVSANADDTFVVDAGAQDVSELAATFADRAWMLQPFVDSVLAEGEHSLFYFAGRYSHAVVKRPKAGDFRVQEEHGGHIAAEEPAGDLRAAADAVLAALDDRLLQARVDLVRLADGRPALMELELIEPSLYFRMDPGAAGRFADALAELTSRPRRTP
jgi:glutathione synthase/RimK-type ligase-like ATP-grasp enzyme